MHEGEDRKKKLNGEIAEELHGSRRQTLTSNRLLAKGAVEERFLIAFGMTGFL